MCVCVCVCVCIIGYLHNIIVTVMMRIGREMLVYSRENPNPDISLHVMCAMNIVVNLNKYTFLIIYSQLHDVEDKHIPPPMIVLHLGCYLCSMDTMLAYANHHSLHHSLVYSWCLLHRATEGEPSGLPPLHGYLPPHIAVV